MAEEQTIAIDVLDHKSAEDVLLAQEPGRHVLAEERLLLFTVSIAANGRQSII